MKKKLQILILLLIIFINTEPYYAGEWVKNGDAWKYKDDNGDFYLDQQRLIDGKWYYFDDGGCVYTGLQKIGDKYYTFNDDGTPKTENITANGKTYLVDGRGNIHGITEAEFMALDDNFYASNSYNAEEQLHPYVERAKNI